MERFETIGKAVSNGLAANLVNALMAGFSKLELRAMGHMLAENNGRTLRKRGLYDAQITAAKDNALKATYKAHDEGKKAIMVMSYGARAKTDVQIALKARMNQPNAMDGAAFFTERGDFTNCFRRGI